MALYSFCPGAHGEDEAWAGHIKMGSGEEHIWNMTE